MRQLPPGGAIPALQRDLQPELTYDGLRAAAAKGNKGGRRPVIPADKTDAVCAAYLEGRSIAALVRNHEVSRGTIRTAVADLLPVHTTIDHEDVPIPELPVAVDMPGKVADFLRAAELEPTERAALDHGVTVRRSQGYTLRVGATPSVHRQLLARCQPLDGDPVRPAVPAQHRVPALSIRSRPKCIGRAGAPYGSPSAAPSPKNTTGGRVSQRRPGAGTWQSSAPGTSGRCN